MWKPTQQEPLWFHGGNLHQSRHYSLYLGLQRKTRCERIPTPVHGLQEVHQLSLDPPSNRRVTARRKARMPL
jgi:putative flavoprotein involved in K+ transport